MHEESLEMKISEKYLFGFGVKLSVENYWEANRTMM